MSYEAEARQFEQGIVANMTDDPQLSSTVGENFIFGVGQTVDYSLTISEPLVRYFGGNNSDKRDQQLKDMRAEGTISDEEWKSFTGWYHPLRPNMTKMDELAKYVNERDGSSIQTDEEIDENMRDSLKRRKAMAEDIFNRSTAAGTAAGITGGFVGFGLEPMNLAAMIAEPVLLAKNAYALSQATTRLGRAMIAAKTGVKVGVVSEAAIQPIIFSWGEEVGEEMTWGDAVMNIAAVGIMSGGIGAASSGIRTKAKFEAEQIAAKIYMGDNKITAGEMAGLLKSINKEAKTVVDDPEAVDLLAQTERALANSDPDMPAEEVLNRIDETNKKYEAQTTKSESYDDVDYEMDEPTVVRDYDAMLEDATVVKKADDATVVKKADPGDDTTIQKPTPKEAADDATEYDLDDPSADRDYEALMQLDRETSGDYGDYDVRDLTDEDLGADYFDFEEIGLTPREKGQKAIDNIEALSNYERNLQICLTGKAP